MELKTVKEHRAYGRNYRGNHSYRESTSRLNENKNNKNTEDIDTFKKDTKVKILTEDTKQKNMEAKYSVVSTKDI